jgi:sulfonate transport system substrate-binding protein
MNHTPSLSRRHFVTGLAAAGLAAPWPLRAQTPPAKVIRLGSPDLGTAGKPSPGANALTIVQANQWLEEEFAKDGIEVQWNFFRGAGPAVAEALAAKQLDIVYLGDLASVIHKSRGLPTRYLVPTGRGSNSYLATAPGSNIKTVSDLKGKRVSVLKGTAYQRPFDNLLATAGLTEKDLKLINMDWPSSKAAVVAGQIDATFGGADLFILRDKGVEIPLSTRGRGPGFEINAGALATADFVTQQPALVQRVVKQLVRAAHWASQEGNREALVKLFASNSGNPELSFREELTGANLAQRYSPLVDDGLIAAYQGVHDEGLKLGLIRQGFDVKSWFEPRFVQQALRELKLESAWRATDAQGKPKGQA